ncbi:hypothetical protein [Streptomyces fulvoviolaceus]|uniref:hypothetical protein n=1 Tax=Streptomyces fulvoviolaceus TaxID=285535 RepID=UPI0021C01CB6|nr:hypothetical protein [Streptomyces fulvoviolaceus]MCT9075647.1 hypothetical protein [Streptomyces fulvoviolaceus]
MTALNAVDPFSRTGRLEALVQRFEARGASLVFSRMLQEYHDAMGIEDAVRVLELGCRTGTVARAVARRANLSGRLLGIDRSPHDASP